MKGLAAGRVTGLDHRKASRVEHAEHVAEAGRPRPSMEDLVEGMFFRALLHRADELPPFPATGDEQNVVEDPPVGSDSKRSPPHRRVDHPIEGMELPISLQAIDRVPLEIADPGVGHGFPVGVPENPRREIEDEVKGHEVIVRDHVGRQMAEISQDERAGRVGLGQGLEPLLDVPVVAMVLHAAVGLEVDDVSGDVPVKKRVLMLEHQGLGSTWGPPSPETSQHGLRELNVGSRAPRRVAGEARRPKDERCRRDHFQVGKLRHVVISPWPPGSSFQHTSRPQTTVAHARDQQPTSFVIRGADVLTDGWLLENCSVLVAKGRIQSVGKAADREARLHGAAWIDGGGAYLAPGYVDLHTHGAVGVDFVEAGSDEFERACRHYLSRGVTSILVSLYPSAFKKSLSVLKRVAGFLRDGVGRGIAVGIHLEGPYLNPLKPGALPGSVFRRFKPAEANALLEAGGGLVRTMTVAPELPRGLELVRFLRLRGVEPAFGHSEADHAQTVRAVSAGVRYATHLFNAMRGIHHREPGAVTALLEDPRVRVELIADGYHIAVPVLKLVHAVKPPDGIILVSDSVHPCGLKTGLYEFAGKPVRAKGGRVTLLDGTLAGSLLTLDRAVKLHVEKVGITPAQAVRCASENAARAIGLGRDRGRIAEGYRADLILLDRSLRVSRVWLKGLTPLRDL